MELEKLVKKYPNDADLGKCVRSMISESNDLNWIEISEINNHNVEGKNILIWQENLSDKECSRFQRAVYYNNDDKSFIQIYPMSNRQIYMKNNAWVEYDLEGDKCQVTHFAIVKGPKN